MGIIRQTLGKGEGGDADSDLAYRGDLEPIDFIRSPLSRPQYSWEMKSIHYGAPNQLDLLGPVSQKLEAASRKMTCRDSDGNLITFWTIPTEIGAKLRRDMPGVFDQTKIDLATQHLFEIIVEKKIALPEDLTTIVLNNLSAGDLLHSSIQPAITIQNKAGFTFAEMWFYLGECHRENDAAIMFWPKDRKKMHTGEVDFDKEDQPPILIKPTERIPMIAGMPFEMVRDICRNSGIDLDISADDIIGMVEEYEWWAL